jgi:hypothetical protein
MKFLNGFSSVFLDSNRSFPRCEGVVLLNNRANQ